MSAAAGVGDQETTPLLDASPASTSPIDGSSSYSASQASSSNDNDGDHVRWTISQSARRLYVSHTLSTWNSRVFEFGSVLYLASIFPGTLLPLSVYAMARGAAAIALSSWVGQYIDREDRLKAVRLSIVSQRLVVAVSCAIFLVLGRVQDLSPGLRNGLLALLVLMACIEKLAAIMNLVSVERDWVVVVAQSDTTALRTMNSQMRRIDLICKLLGPFFIGIMDSISTETAIFVNLGMNCTSVIVEYFTIARVYHQVPELQQPKTTPRIAELDGENSQQTAQGPWRSLKKAVRKLRQDLGLYFNHPVFVPSFAGALLYCNVLSFSGVMVTYLLSSGYTSTQIAVARTVSVAFEVLATWVGPWLMKRIGPVRAGLWFSTWQLSCLAVGISIFWRYSDNVLVSTLGLVGGSILSRVGLWGFDLSTQIIIQEETEASLNIMPIQEVEAENRGAFSAVEASWQSLFEMCSYTSTIIFSSPSQFHNPTALSVTAVFCAWALYSRFVRKRRGHLVHWPACMSAEKQQGSMDGLFEAMPRRRREGL
ncbi:hypothetical protein FZEAL_7451 [Fusarium zealandicum]|uniref:Solute carrier family 40 member n=1 Tax=Fusarium zealandicum TaxID=1053134 RepID=A0A8H4UGK5_9HYPO|nr:hypothetical protein FZEAL_7451 [Fusarium zealandicum]